MNVRPQVDEALEGVRDHWRTALARTLADAIDESPNAAMAAELRRLMDVIHEKAGAAKEGSTVDDLAARRAARRAAAAGSS